MTRVRIELRPTASSRKPKLGRRRLPAHESPGSRIILLNMRYPRLRDVENEKNEHGRVLCRECHEIVPSGRRSYCSDKCMNKYNRENSWYWVRKDVLRRDKWKCSICNKRFRKKELDVDHIIPVNMGGQLFDKRNLRTLCKECHKAKTKLDREAQN